MRPNILLITTDQQRFDTIHALGNPYILTPHLNWLADDGTAFTRCYADCPVCMPSRATLMTGLFGHTTGLTRNIETIIPMRDHPTLPGVLTANGYQTRAQGKMHFTPMRAHYGFEQMELPADYFRQAERGDSMPKQHGVGENEMEPVISTADATHSIAHWTVRRSIDFLETRDTTRPFFLWTSFTKPHPPLDPSLSFWMLYQNSSVPPPVIGDWAQNARERPHGFMGATYELNNIQRFSEERLRDIRRAYYACITEVDYALGLLFARMREMGLLDNTWILFTSDHGEMLGDHHMGAKCVHLEGSAHVPLLIRRPGGARPGERRRALAMLADVYPTLLSMAGLKPPEPVDGTDILRDEFDSEPDREFFGTEGDSLFCLMRENRKYLWSAHGNQELLFDLHTDPMERRDLSADAAYAALRNELRARLIVRMRSIGSARVRECDLHGERMPGPEEWERWPGFHSVVEPSDVLH